MKNPAKNAMKRDDDEENRKIHQSVPVNGGTIVSEEELACSCGKSISVKGVSKHFNDCDHMKKKYK